jgi:C4-type Zn-finger protein
MDNFSNIFNKEPKFYCPVCGKELFTDWVDNGFGPYSVQVSPYVCECGWSEKGCDKCIKEKCFSWAKCKGKAVI